jgi:hypothetical protein
VRDKRGEQQAQEQRAEDAGNRDFEGLGKKAKNRQKILIFETFQKKAKTAKKSGKEQEKDGALRMKVKKRLKCSRH